MRRTLTLILGAALFGILAAVVVASESTDDPAGSDVGTTATETVERTTTGEDDPKPRERKVDDDAIQSVDISGPCDEAEHANDPRCTGGGETGRVDNSGPGSLNSGPGGAADDDDRWDDDDHDRDDDDDHRWDDDHGGDDDDYGDDD